MKDNKESSNDTKKKGFFKRGKSESNVEEKVTLDINIPTHIAIIPDGNRRWAAKRGLSKKAGHREGANNFKKIVIAASKLKVKYITFYAFSTENWSRDEDEVNGLMDLMLEFLKNAERELSGYNVAIRVIGNIEPLSKELKKEIHRVETATAKYEDGIINIAINYGGRDELLHATKKIAQGAKNGQYNIDDINFDTISNSLYTCDSPDPDLLIRTSGETRMSNFLLWQMAYTELWFTKTLWPDFSEAELMEAIKEYSRRTRRFGS